MEHGGFDGFLRAALVAACSYSALAVGFVLISLATAMRYNLPKVRVRGLAFRVGQYVYFTPFAYELRLAIVPSAAGSSRGTGTLVNCSNVYHF
jgi:hypothetical protein